MDQGTFEMSQWEREKMVVLEAVRRGEISVRGAARRLKISRRHAIRLKQRYLAGGAVSLTHRARGRPGNRRPREPFDRRQVIGLYRERYPDFGPTLAAEKLAERDGIRIRPETLRRLLIEAGLWQSRPRRGPHRTRRPRRARFGQMLQLDGSDHDWLEGRGPRACLMVLIDDATGWVMLHLAPAETTEAALVVVRKWVERHGVPESIYTDRNTVYWAQKALDRPELRERRQVHSEWGRVMVGNLGIALIPSHSPQGRGRVERGNGTFQDRLVKELRLRGISTIEEANRFLDAHYIDRHNAMFAIEPAREQSAHRAFAPRDQHEHELAFSVDFERTVARDNTVSLAGRCYQIAAQQGAPRPGAKVTLWRAMDGAVRCQWAGRALAIKPFDPKADRFRRRCGFEKASAGQENRGANGAGAREALGDQSPRPHGIYRLGAKARAVKKGCGSGAGKKKSGIVSGEKKEGAVSADRPTLASASGPVLGLRPRMALSPVRSKPLSRKRTAAGR